MHRCAACRVAFASPFPSPQDLIAYYGSGYHPPWAPPDRVRARAAFAARVLREEGVTEGGALLDFGAGNGNYAVELGRLGFAVSGLELADEEREIANRRGVPTVRDLSELPHHSFQAVLARHVIEHVPDPLATLRSLRDVLEPGGRGVLLIGVPNFGSLAARLLRGGWEWFAPPAHLWYFDRAALSRLMVEVGFRDVRVTETQGDGTPLPLAVSVAPARLVFRRRAPPGYWRSAVSREDGTGATAPRPRAGVGAYLWAMGLVKRVWPWGDEELWVSGRT